MPLLFPSTTIALLTFLSLSLTQAVTHIVTATSTLPPTTITLAAASASPTTVSPSYTSEDDFQFSILNSTNFFRYLHPALYLHYNTTLAAFAQSYSENCDWQHNPDISEMGYGENLAKGYATPGEAVDAWGNEATLFNFDDDDYTGFTEETGHFTQLVWRGTRSVGCGWTSCDGKNRNDGILLVCNYFPAGNIMSSADGGDKYTFFKQNVVPQRSSGAEGFNADDAGHGVGGHSGTATKSVAGTATADSGAVPRMRAAGVFGEGWRGMLGSLLAAGVGVVIGAGLL